MIENFNLYLSLINRKYMSILWEKRILVIVFKKIIRVWLKLRIQKIKNKNKMILERSFKGSMNWKKISQ